MVLWIIPYVEEMSILFHVFVDVLGGNVVAQAVCVSEEQFCLWVLLLDVVVVEFVHEGFAESQNRKPNLYGFVEHEICLQELYSYQTLVENLKPVERGLGHNLFETPFRLNHLHVDSFSNILHGFTKNGIVHQFKEVFAAFLFFVIKAVYSANHLFCWDMMAR